MRFERLLRIISANVGAKIISIVFAIFLWLHVTAQQEDKQTFRVPLVLSGIPDSLTIIHDVPGFAEVTIGGARSNLLKLRLFGRLKATIDLSMAKKGRINTQLTSAALNLPEGLDPRDVTFDDPKSLNLNFEHVITKVVPVKLAYKGEIPRDVVILGNPVIIPNKVKVRGAASIVSGISFLTTEEVEVRGKKGRFTQEVSLRPGGRDISVLPNKVLIEMEISKRGVRTIANVPPTLLQDDETVIVDYSPKAVSLTVEGPEETIKNLVLDDVSIILDLTAKNPGIYRIEPSIIVPEGIERYWLDIDAFEITIHPPASTDSTTHEKE